LHILIAVFPAGLWFTMKKLDDSRVFLILWAIFGSYFAGVMVRLMLTLTPCVCMVSAIAFTELLTPFFKDALKTQKADDESEAAARANASNDVAKRSKASAAYIEQDNKKDAFGPTGPMFSVRTLVTGITLLTLVMFAIHCCWVTSNAYSSPSVVLATQGQDGSRHILDDFREGYNWIRMNTPEDTKIMSWWDYGYQIAGFANRTTLVDNNTWNNSHIALVGKAMASDEDNAIKIMRMLDVNYVLVIFGGVIGYSGDDINKFLWMVRIAEGEHPNDVKESSFFTDSGEYRVDEAAPKTFKESIMYKTSFYRFDEHMATRGYDRTRNQQVGVKNIKFKYLEEAYTSENWLVRIYRVKEPANRDGKMKIGNRKKFSTKKTSKKRQGTLRAGSYEYIDPVAKEDKVNTVTKEAKRKVTGSEETLDDMDKGGKL